ncbi:DUF2935 domain-containing protein [Bacillus sp. FJAT-49736]|uniref:DUF2935 domain-containing protein n=1 Tax=Bacillus sp. FJAT-49736 TaxID=2833582 RepID=UPI0020165511|nr:DUF2935 domain-containing protein [Bacillus sp. FJAT-49736]
MTKKLISIWEEHFFWLEVLQDHAFFVRDHLSVTEVEYVQTAQQYIQLFGNLLGMIKNIPKTREASDELMIEFSKQAWSVARGYFEFEGKLQSLRIDNNVNLNLSPTYLNGTLAENQEYLRILNYLVQGMEPEPLSLIYLMDLWLEDQLGHAVLFRNLVDPIEVFSTKQIEGYINKYQVFIVQNHHLKGYLRFKEPGFARQQEFAREVGQTTIEMSRYIYSMVTKYKENKVLNKTTLRFLEHHFPETCYFIKKLSFYDPSIQEPASRCSLRRPSYLSSI